MDIAIKAPSVNSAQAIKRDEAKKAAVYTRRIIRIEGPAGEREFIQDHTFFNISTIHQTINILKKENDGSVDAVLINPTQLTNEFPQLKELLKAKAIPFFIYTPQFDKAAKEAAVGLGADDYHYGPITTGLYKRVDFVKKLKAYKAQRGAAPYSTMSVVDVPQVKLWTLKRAFDILVSGTALLMISPLLLLIALIIELES